MDEMEQKDILKAVFDALPSMVFVVDQDMRIQEYNAAASDLLKSERTTIIKQRAGDILHCVHSREVQEGCGKGPSCKVCIVRNSVREAFQGNRVVRRRTRVVLSRHESRLEIYALISASPFSFRNSSLVLLVIEDISEVAELRRLIPICSICKKVRDDKESWKRLETYFNDNWDVDFSHGYCPDCYRSEMARLKLED